MEDSTGVPGPDIGDCDVAAVSIVAASADQRPLVDRLLQVYLHDFSEHLPRSSPWCEVDEEGRFVHPPGLLDPYWQEPGHVPLLIRADGRVAGFVLLNQQSALGLPTDHAVAEFFVLRKYPSRRRHPRRPPCLQELSRALGTCPQSLQSTSAAVLAQHCPIATCGKIRGTPRRRKWLVWRGVAL
jgi:hypothetical protein